MNKKRKSIMATVLLVGTLAVLGTGCAGITKDKLAMYSADAYDVAAVSTRITLNEAPGATNGLQKTIVALEVLERQPELVTPAQLLTVVTEMPINKLQSTKAQLYALTAKLLLRRIELDTGVGTLKPIVTALKEGVLSVYKPPVAPPV